MILEALALMTRWPATFNLLASWESHFTELEREQFRRQNWLWEYRVWAGRSYGT